MPSWTQLALFAALSLASAGLTAAMVVLAPVDALVSHHPFEQRFRSTAVRILFRVAKNLVGAALVILGAFMALPGVPGQGLLTIGVGLMLIDFPGRKERVRKLISRPMVWGAVDRLRVRFGRPTLLRPDREPGSEGGDPGH